MPGLINVITGVYLISAACYFFVPVVSALLVAAFLTLLILSRQFGNGVIDWMFKKTTTRNIMATFAPKGKRTQTLIFSGHHDSPDMMPMLGLRTKRYVHLIEQSIVVGMALLIPAGILRAILAGPVISRPFGLAWYDVIFGISLVGLAVGVYFPVADDHRRQEPRAPTTTCRRWSCSWESPTTSRRTPRKTTRSVLVSFGSEEPFMYGSWGFAQGNRS